MSERLDFGKTGDGKDAGLFILKNKQGMQAHVTDYGATLVRLLVPDRNGDLKDVVLGYDHVSGYETGHGHFGATVGRFANRIGGACFEMNGKTYHLVQNNGVNTLHGGKDFYKNRFFRVEQGDDPEKITFVLESPDGDQGFPGAIFIEVTYSLTEVNGLKITYHVTWQDGDGQDGTVSTPLSLTNHSYFNLAGHDSGSVLDQIVMINADEFTPADAGSIPTGQIQDLTGSPLDFRTPKPIGRDIDADCEQLKFGGGYDHNYVLKSGNPAAVMYSERTGIRMSVFTDLPGMQFYTANNVDHACGKEGAVYEKRSAACFETQFWPDCINKENFPGGVLKAGEEFTSVTEYRFDLV